MNPGPLVRRSLEAMGYPLWVRRSTVLKPAPRLAERGLPPVLRARLERWVGALWQEWSAPEGTPRDAAFKRALWRRVRDWRRGG